VIQELAEREGIAAVLDMLEESGIRWELSQRHREQVAALADGG
jgi:hypothetical protein